jgi:hypothetical protein
MHICPLAASILAASALLAQGIPEGPEPNETPSTATIYAPGIQAEGAINVAGDKDWFLFTLSTASDIRATTGWAVGVTVDVDTVLTLFESDGATIVGVNDDRGLDRYSMLDLANVPANTPANPFYLLEVKHFQATGTGGYVLDLQAKAPTTPVTEGLEPNDPRLPLGAPTPGTIETLHSGFLAVGGAGTTYTSVTADYDFYQLVVPAPMTLLLETKDEVLSPATDTVIHIADAALTRLAFDDDSGALALSRLEYVVTTPGVYYVAVSGFGATSGLGNYVLNVRSTLPTFVAPLGGCAGSAGTPRLSVRGTNPTELPWLGMEFFVDEANLPVGAIYFRLLGTSALPVPFDLGPLGAPGCLVEVSALSTLLAFAPPSGLGFWGIALPGNPGYAGLTLHWQIAVLDLPANSLGVTVSNKASGTVRLQ